MGNRSETHLWIITFLHLTTLYLAFWLYLLTSSVGGGSPTPYTPVENTLVNCGFSGNSSALDGRTWIGDEESRFFPLEQLPNKASQTAGALQQPPSADKVPYATARLSTSAFTYTFRVTPGQKFIRLYFYPASYGGFDRSKALFSVKAGNFTLLNNFNASLTADADVEPQDIIFREYCVNIDEDQRLNITFTPSVSNSYAFISGIEILSMPTNLYYTPSYDREVPLIGLQVPYGIDISNNTALEMVHRVNVGGGFISPSDDTGLFRSWTPDNNYLRISRSSLIQVNTTIELSYTKETPAYTAPEDVYRTAITMGNETTINKSYNLTWEFSVDSKFVYLVRLHFCEIQPQITQAHQRKFLIFIANQTAEKAADVIIWSGGNGVPVYRDYVVSMFGKEGLKKMNLSIALEANPIDWQTVYSDAILNGVEIFKVSDYDGNLAGSNPDPLLLNPPIVVPPGPQKKPKSSTTTIVAGVGGGVSGFVVLWILGLLIYRWHKGVKDSKSSDGTSWWGAFSLSSTKSMTNHKSPLPHSLCRYFTLAEIQVATNNFDNTLVVGGGGFGTVYKGYTDGGANSVAIKRLKSGSQQGAHEFETEIKMLSQLRHLNLVSLVGYCNDGNEMILVYDYMVRGTLREHLYDTDNPPLTWKQRLEICIGAARGLDYLHTSAKEPIIHRDVKTTNILLDEKWVAKMSDFGLSKVGPTGISKSHVSTVVKGSFGYLDPEYYRRQHLSDKSDVYSFGVVLCEVLCAKPPIIRTEEPPVGLARWVRENYRNGKVKQMVDPALEGQIVHRSLKKFVVIAMRCLLENGTKRPSMNDVVSYLEFALQLQESAGEDMGLELSETELDNDKALFPMSTDDDSDDTFSTSNTGVTIVSRGEQRSATISGDSSKLMFSRTMFAESQGSVKEDSQKGVVSDVLE